LFVWEWLVLVYFLYLAIVAFVQPAMRRRRVQVCAVAVAVSMLVLSAPHFVKTSVFADVRSILPVGYIGIGYWLSGRFFLQPMRKWEHRLAAGNRWLSPRLDLNTWVRRTHRFCLEWLEFVYSTTFLLVPAGYATLLLLGDSSLIKYYWTLVISAEFIPFAMLPWIQTRPPWAIQPPGVIDARRVYLRQFSMAMVRHASIRANTFPSGHAAASLAIGLAVARGSSRIGVLFLGLALSSAFACIIGGYHYILDVAAGIALTLVLWAILAVFRI
jgi:membrane-associated phospholipid phosphatase